MKRIRLLTLLIPCIILYSCEPNEVEKIQDYDLKDISIPSVGVHWRSIQMLDEKIGYIGGIPTIKSIVQTSFTHELMQTDTFMYNVDYTYEEGELPEPCLYKTFNEGETWQEILTPFRNGIKQIQFIDSQIGYISTFDEGVFKTTNGGNSWDRILGLVYYGNGSFIDSDYNICFKDNLNGFCNYESNKPFTLFTNDGGETWSVVDDVNRNYIFYDNYTLYAKTTTKLYKKNDNSDIWMQLDIDADMLFDIYFHSSDWFLVSKGNKIDETKDGGATWISYPLPNYFSTDKLVLFNNEAFMLDQTGIYHFDDISQIDKRENEYLMSRQRNERIFDIDFPNATFGFAVGDNGLILKYENN